MYMKIFFVYIILVEFCDHLTITKLFHSARSTETFMKEFFVEKFISFDTIISLVINEHQNFGSFLIDSKFIYITQIDQ